MQNLRVIKVFYKSEEYDENEYFGFNSGDYSHSIVLDKDDYKVILQIILKSKRDKDDMENVKYLITKEIAKEINNAKVLIDFNIEKFLYLLGTWDAESFLFKTFNLEDIE